MNAEKKLAELGIVLPETAAPKAKYVPVKQAGNLLFVAGQGPFVDGGVLHQGRVGENVTLGQAQEAARACAVNILAAVRGYLGSLDRVRSVVKVQAFVNSVVGFNQQHLVVNGASGLLVDVFGEEGCHARTAVGTNQLPLDMPVEVEAIFEI